MQINPQKRKQTFKNSIELIEIFSFELELSTKMPFAIYNDSGILLIPAEQEITEPSIKNKLIEIGAYTELKEFKRYLKNIKQNSGEKERLIQWLNDDSFDILEDEYLMEIRNKVLSYKNPFNDFEFIKQTLKNLIKHPHIENWLQKLDSLQIILEKTLEQNKDATIFYLIQACSKINNDYSIHHSLICSIISYLIAQELKLSNINKQQLMFAALTMNMSMMDEQNHLTLQKTPLNEEQKTLINNHGALSEKILINLGVKDSVWLDLVKNHHRQIIKKTEYTTFDILHMILHYVDILTAKISPRITRASMTSGSAIKQVYQQVASINKDFGTAILNTFGIYPPGTYVKLKNDEICVVLSPGHKINTPLVGTVLNHDGMPFVELQIRDTSNDSYLITECVKNESIKAMILDWKILPYYRKQYKIN